jgi:hypothetical protein
MMTSPAAWARRAQRGGELKKSDQRMTIGDKKRRALTTIVARPAMCLPRPCSCGQPGMGM